MKKCSLNKYTRTYIWAYMETEEDQGKNWLVRPLKKEMKSSVYGGKTKP